jgi:nucleotide-binding universal stress UspA family protein
MLPLRTILHATDFSEHAENALWVATALAHDHQARLLILHVQPPIYGFAGEGMAFLRHAGEDPNTAVARLMALHPNVPNVAVEHRLRIGSPAEEILRLAGEAHADLIVLGTHGRRGLRRLLMGSVAEEVLRRAACPVLTVKTPMPETEAEPASPVAEESTPT